MAIKRSQYHIVIPQDEKCNSRQNCKTVITTSSPLIFYLMLRLRIIGTTPPPPHTFPCRDSSFVTGTLFLYEMLN
jgi:hypothetical protein